MKTFELFTRGLPGALMFTAAAVHSTTAADSSLPSDVGAAVIVAARDSSPESKTAARFVADGEGDQEQISAAIRALPPVGGTVLLMEGTYDIRRVAGKLGGVIIDRGHVTLAGQGTATRLVLAPNQNVNVIRIIGSGVGHITIRDLCVDANRALNREGAGDPNISHTRSSWPTTLCAWGKAASSTSAFGPGPARSGM